MVLRVSVGIIGAYSLKYESRSQLEAWDMMRESIKGVLNSVDKGIDPRDIELVIVSNFSDSYGNLLHSGPLAIDYLGNPSAKAFRVENACVSGSTALYIAYNFLKAGLARNALIVGFEKMSTQPSGSAANEILARAAHPLEIVAGASFVGLYALIAKAYMDKYGLKEEDMALVAVKNHENAMRNPLAQFRRKITIEEVLSSQYVAWPLKLMDSSPLTDGAAALIVSAEPKMYTDTPAYIKGISMAHDKPGVFQREDLTMLRAIKEAADNAYRQAGVTARNINVFEVHDAFTIAEIVIYEMLGLAERGKGASLLKERTVWFDGSHPVNVSGGLKAKGHPIGATGVGMLAEVFWQVRGEAGERQVKDAEIGLVENHGGTGATAVVTILSR